VDSYVVVEACSWVNSQGTEAHVAQPGATVELDETEAATLGGAVRLLGAPAKQAKRRVPEKAPEIVPKETISGE
jgi:hypothetical protein